VHPVIVLSAVFCIVWSFWVFVSESMGDHTVLAYSMTVLVIVLYVVSSVSFDLPQCVVVSALMIFSVELALDVVFCICFEYVSFGSKVNPNIFGSLLVGSI